MDFDKVEDTIVDKMEVYKIHQTYINGNINDAVKGIKEYKPDMFWSAYKAFLFEYYVTVESQYSYFSELVISYSIINSGGNL